ncbi:MAG TPA: hypothetical protein VEK08_01310 [Planctomycetota bacterium]|nr:hypothetical protein [Planctomycetota bacterium]
MSKSKTQPNDASEVTQPAQSEPAKKLLPTPLLVAFALVVLAGFALGFTRDTRLHSELFEAMDKCDAQTLPEQNGISDAFGVVKINSQQSGITDYLSLCEQNPPLARSIFRQALEKTGKSPRLVALYSSFYLAGSNALEASDIDSIAALLDGEKQKDAEVRRTAQRALSDLIFINDTLANQSKWHELPEKVKTAASDGPSHRIVTREEKLRPSDKTGLGIRWSNPDLALAWWSANKSRGKWDPSLQRYIIEGLATTKNAEK